MENPQLIELANDFFEKAKAIDPNVTQVIIKCDGAADEKFMPVGAEKMKANLASGCYWFPGIGVVCF